MKKLIGILTLSMGIVTLVLLHELNLQIGEAVGSVSPPGSMDIFGSHDSSDTQSEGIGYTAPSSNGLVHTSSSNAQLAGIGSIISSSSGDEDESSSSGAAYAGELGLGAASSAGKESASTAGKVAFCINDVDITPVSNGACTMSR